MEHLPYMQTVIAWLYTIWGWVTHPIMIFNLVVYSIYAIIDHIRQAASLSIAVGYMASRRWEYDPNIMSKEKDPIQEMFLFIGGSESKKREINFLCFKAIWRQAYRLLAGPTRLYIQTLNTCLYYRKRKDTDVEVKKALGALLSKYQKVFSFFKSPTRYIILLFTARRMASGIWLNDYRAPTEVLDLKSAIAKEITFARKGLKKSLLRIIDFLIKDEIPQELDRLLRKINATSTEYVSVFNLRESAIRRHKKEIKDLDSLMLFVKMQVELEYDGLSDDEKRTFDKQKVIQKRFKQLKKQSEAKAKAELKDFLAQLGDEGAKLTQQKTELGKKIPQVEEAHLKKLEQDLCYWENYLFKLDELEFKCRQLERQEYMLLHFIYAYKKGLPKLKERTKAINDELDSLKQEQSDDGVKIGELHRRKTRRFRTKNLLLERLAKYEKLREANLEDASKQLEALQHILDSHAARAPERLTVLKPLK